MANIKELKKRIRSTKGTLKITSAMKLVSAAKLARAQANILGARPYALELDNTIKTVSALAKDYQHDFLKENQENKMAHLLVISSNKGLCGGYNTQLAKKIMSDLTGELKEYDVKVHFIGKKVKEQIEKDINLGTFYQFEKMEPSHKEIKDICLELASSFTSGEVGKVFVAYNIFHSALSFEPTVKQVLPISVDASEKENLEQKFPFDFKYEPEPALILDSLIPEAFITNIYTCLLDAIAAEHGTRMSSMESAATNCKDMIRTLTLKANKLRQAAITTELIEVVSGAESLNG